MVCKRLWMSVIRGCGRGNRSDREQPYRRSVMAEKPGKDCFAMLAMTETMAFAEKLCVCRCEESCDAAI
ncbi:hypothetical protein [Syntrophomonas palmitatica]|uniref:hypothetical protein n=1 Tax=Syntrophomonas palmitatica TaxID=402877 RepID=UPI0012EE125C|nr:hypothetical protein [Syntrophomonas palmitatica]